MTGKAKMKAKDMEINSLKLKLLEKNAPGKNLIYGKRNIGNLRSRSGQNREDDSFEHYPIQEVDEQFEHTGKFNHQDVY